MARRLLCHLQDLPHAFPVRDDREGALAREKSTPHFYFIGEPGYFIFEDQLLLRQDPSLHRSPAPEIPQ